MEKTRFVFKFVQVARNRKSKKKQISTISSVASDTMSMDSSSTVSLAFYTKNSLFTCRELQIQILFNHFQSTEYRDSSISKTENLTDVDGVQSSLSADDSADLFCEDGGMYQLI